MYLLQRLGDAFFVVCIGSLFFVFGHFENSFDSVENILIRIFFFLALITKSANFPFNSWLPLAMAAPTPVSALVHSSTLVTAGVYLLIRYNYIVEELSFLILVCSLITGIGGRFWACFEYDLKKIIAYSTTAKLGFMTFSLGLGNIKGAFLHLILHACFKALLFVRVGHFLYVFHVQDIRSVGSFFYVRNLLRWCVVFCVRSIVSLPFFSGFFSKHFILRLSLKTYKKIFILFFLCFYVFLRGFYGWRLISFIVTQKNYLFSLNFKYNVFSTNYKLVILGIFRVLFLGQSIYMRNEGFDFYSLVFFIFGFFGAYLGFSKYPFFEIFPSFLLKFYSFLVNIGRISPVKIK